MKAAGQCGAAGSGRDCGKLVLPRLVLRGLLWTVSHGHVGMGTQYGQIVRVSFLKATFWILYEVSRF